MIINAKEKNIGKLMSVFACVLAALCIVLSVFSPRTVQITAVAESGATYMTMETEELPLDGAIRRSAGNAQIYGNGNFMDSLAKPVMTVVHFPAIAEVKLNTTIRKRYTEGTAELYFRIVQEHADTGLNEVIYPKDGTWLYLNDGQQNEEGTGYINVRITEYVKAKPGDKLKLIVKNVNNGSWCTAVLDGGLSLIYDGGTADGINFTYSNPALNYAQSDTGNDEIPERFQGYYGVGAVKSDVITYEYITSYTDHTE